MRAFVIAMENEAEQVRPFLRDGDNQILSLKMSPIKEIASQCGYQDELFFHRIFRKYTKCPPAYYRKYFVF